jgi:hypothetical protein
MTTAASVAALVYGVGTLIAFTFAVMHYLDARDDGDTAHIGEAARLVLTAPLWPLIIRAWARTLMADARR